MELLTNSRLKTLDDCPRREWWMYGEGVRPRNDGEALRIGSLVHRALEAWLNARIDFAGEPDAWLVLALDAIAGRAFDAYEQVKVEEMIRGYHTRWHAEELDVVAVEHQFVFPVNNPSTRGKSKTFMHAGKLDGVVRWGGRLCLLEHKTCGDEIDDPSAAYWETLAMDAQVSLYYLGAESLGWKLEGCLYDVLKKPGLRPAKATPEDQRKYTAEKIDKKTGEVLEPSRLYANQRAEDETPEEYRARIRAAIEADPARHYVRKEIHRLDVQLRQFMRNAWGKATALRETHAAAREEGVDSVLQVTAACHRFGRCFLFDVCSAGLNPDDFPERFARLDNKHPELDPDLIQSLMEKESTE